MAPGEKKGRYGAWIPAGGYSGQPHRIPAGRFSGSAEGAFSIGFGAKTVVHFWWKAV